MEVADQRPYVQMNRNLTQAFWLLDDVINWLHRYADCPDHCPLCYSQMMALLTTSLCSIEKVINVIGPLSNAEYKRFMRRLHQIEKSKNNSSVPTK